MGVPGKRSIIDTQSVLVPFNGLSVYMDTCGRVCKCRVCEGSIRSGEKRFVISLGTLQQTGVGGGRITNRKAFFHPECMSKYLDAPPSNLSPHLRCVECGGDSATLRARISASHFSNLCHPCADSGSWDRCGNCAVLVPKYRISRMTNVVVDVWKVRSNCTKVCDDCQQCYDVATEKSEKTKKRNERKAEIEFLEAKQRILARYS